MSEKSYKGKGKGSNPNSKKNLIQFDQMSKEQRKEFSARGQKKYKENNRKRKLFKDCFLELLQHTATPEMKQTVADMYGVDVETVQDVVTASITSKALQGDVKAFEALRGTIGEDPVKKNELTGANGESIVKKVYITEETARKTDNLIDSAIDDK